MKKLQMYVGANLVETDEDINYLMTHSGISGLISYPYATIEHIRKVKKIIETPENLAIPAKRSIFKLNKKV